MTPKEKALELFDKFLGCLIRNSNSYIDNGFIENQAKRCTLIAVDEILDLGLGFMHDDTAWNLEKYWQEVKQEILKL